MATSSKGNIMQLKLLLVTSILLSMLTSSLQQSVAVDSSAEIDRQWTNFKVEFGKSYANASEESFRHKIFVKSLKQVEAHNTLYSKGITSYTAGINQFSDMEDEEFTELMTCKGVTDSAADSKIESCESISDSTPYGIDWRNTGYVTEVQNQSTCGACWAFAATGALEALNFRRTNTKSVPLSEQDLVDCSSQYGNKGCKGGSPKNAFEYVKSHGINSDGSYVYEGINSTCRHKSSDNAGSCTEYKNMSCESNIQNFVGSLGPIAVHMFAPTSFKDYSGGIYQNGDCKGTSNHAVLIVGYGTDSTTKEDYWIIKNSYGTSWGIDGYALVLRNEEMCGIGSFAIYPVNDSTSSYESASIMDILLLPLFINLLIRK